MAADRDLSCNGLDALRSIAATARKISTAVAYSSSISRFALIGLAAGGRGASRPPVLHGGLCVMKLGAVLWFCACATGGERSSTIQTVGPVAIRRMAAELAIFMSALREFRRSRFWPRPWVSRRMTGADLAAVAAALVCNRAYYTSNRKILTSMPRRALRQTRHRSRKRCLLRAMRSPSWLLAIGRSAIRRQGRRHPCSNGAMARISIVRNRLDQRRFDRDSIRQ